MYVSPVVVKLINKVVKSGKKWEKFYIFESQSLISQASYAQPYRHIRM